MKTTLATRKPSTAQAEIDKPRPPAKGTLERRIYDMLATYPAETKFDVIAHELWRDCGSWSVNDSWRLGGDCSVPEVLTHARGRFEVFKVNYCSKARVSAIADTSCDSESPHTLDCEGIPFLEIRPCIED
jgi:hypothetical protein